MTSEVIGLKTKYQTSVSKPHIWIHIDEQFHMKQFSNRREVKNENTLEKDYISWIYDYLLIFDAKKNIID